MHTGTVKFFNVSRGFGFVAADDPNVGDVFVHISAVFRAGRDLLRQGDRLRFVTVRTRGGRVRAESLENAED